MRRRLLARLFAAAVALTALPAARGDTPPPDKTSTSAPATVWETARTTSPDTVDELKALQSKVKGVYKKALPTTVALLLGGDAVAGGSAGSGVIVSDDGLVLTAAHVIGKPREPVLFELSDGRRVRGVSLGLNTRSDGGMAKITDPPPKDFAGAKDGKWAFAEVGAGAGLKKGQWVVSLGHPGGPKRDRPPPVRTGRFVDYEKGFGQRSDLLRTDATLVGGDSGGPLFDLDGKVVGIHSEIGETLDENRHVPLEKFKEEWDRMARGDILYFRPAGRRETPAQAREAATRVALNVEYDDEATKVKGAKILEVKEDGVADKAGLEAGDVITKFNGFAVKSVDDLKAMLPSYKVGERVKVEVDRGGTPITVDLKLADKGKK